MPAWIDKNKKKCSQKIHIIVENNTGENLGLEERCVYKRNLESIATQEEDTYERAMVNQHNDIEVLMEQLASRLIECQATDLETFFDILKDKCDKHRLLKWNKNAVDFDEVKAKEIRQARKQKMETDDGEEEQFREKVYVYKQKRH